MSAPQVRVVVEVEGAPRLRVDARDTGEEIRLYDWLARPCVLAELERILALVRHFVTEGRDI